MCLITRFPRIKTKKDIEVYKVLRNNLKSPFVSYQYSFNSLVESDLKASSENNWIASGYFQDIMPSEVIPSARPFFGVYVPDTNLHIQFVEEGLHSYRNVDYAISFIFRFSGCMICKAIIPAGSYIYINYNEIVSDKLIIKEQVL